MPLYEYKCEGCGEVFEVQQKFADEPLTVHEKCGGHLERLISAPALQFKGSGWYVTDYAKGGNGGASKTAGSESKSSSDTTTKPADSKPAASDKTTKTD
jgi:putative FmdB family regulatory protein